MSREKAGQWLRYWREETGLNQRELAAKIGLGYYTQISNYEFGRTRLPNASFMAYADALGVSRVTFSRTLLGCYEPELHACLFGSDPTGEIDTPDKLHDRIARLEKTLSQLAEKTAG